MICAPSLLIGVLPLRDLDKTWSLDTDWEADCLADELVQWLYTMLEIKNIFVRNVTIKERIVSDRHWLTNKEPCSGAWTWSAVSRRPLCPPLGPPRSRWGWPFSRLRCWSCWPAAERSWRGSSPGVTYPDCLCSWLSTQLSVWLRLRLLVWNLGRKYSRWEAGARMQSNKIIILVFMH